MASASKEIDEKIAADMDAADPEQKEMMKEECIVVTDDDVPIGPGSKKECKECSRSHRNNTTNEEIMLPVRHMIPCKLS